MKFFWSKRLITFRGFFPKFKIFGLRFLIVCLITSCAGESSLQYVKYVDPFIGTGGYVLAPPGAKISYDELTDTIKRYPFGGMTFPGASVPFGMIQLGPDANTIGQKWSPGYHYSDTAIVGFSHQHTSGNGMGFAHFSLMPYSIKKEMDFRLASAPIVGRLNHENEIAEPGYYSVLMDDINVKVELTATKRAAFHKYTFLDSEQKHIVLDLSHGIGPWAHPEEVGIEMMDNNIIQAYRKVNGEKDAFFIAEVSENPSTFSIYSEGRVTSELKVISKEIRLVMSFDSEISDEIFIKSAISFTGFPGAAMNLAAEIGTSDFNSIKLRAQNEWEKELGKIQVKGGNPEHRRIFYTALYHNYLAPFLFNDVDGKTIDPRGNIHDDLNYERYTFFSLWDTYRATFPLFTIIQPERLSDMINTMLFHARNSTDQLLPMWELAGSNDLGMTGFPAIPIITEAYAKGIRNFDIEEAYDFMKKNASSARIPGIEEYSKYGFVPFDSLEQSVTRTLEFAYNDACMAKMAGFVQKKEDQKRFLNRSMSYKKLYDEKVGFMRGKNSKLEWRVPFDPREVGHHGRDQDFMEANSWQSTWSVQHDIPGLIKLMGGDTKFSQKLDSLFLTESKLTGAYSADVSGLIGQYAQGNEHSHHVAYLYNYVDKPWKTQEIVDKIIRTTYSLSPDGLSGNDDAGQLSAWFVFSAMGFYPVDPCSSHYLIGKPLFPFISINVNKDNNRRFIIRANNLNEQNIYVQSIKLNDSIYTKNYINHSQIVNGGEMILEMGPKPNKNYSNGI